MTDSAERIETIDTIRELKKEENSGRVDVDADMNANDNVAQETKVASLASLQREFEEIKKRSSIELYRSASKVIKCVIYTLALGFVLSLAAWCYLEWDITYGEHSEARAGRILELISKLESLFNYMLTAGIGYAGGIVKTFFNSESK